MVIQFEGDIRPKTFRNIREERQRLKEDPQFQAGVNILYDTILSQNPELSVAIDEVRRYNKDLQKNWKEKNKQKLREYRVKLNLTYRKNNKCVICGAKITDKATRCRSCFLKTLKHGEHRHEDRREENSTFFGQETGAGKEQTGMPETVPRLPDGNNTPVQNVSILPKKEGEQK